MSLTRIHKYFQMLYCCYASIFLSDCCLFVVVSYRENDIVNKSKRVFYLHDCATFLTILCLVVAVP